jgi:hypothetical protein
VTLSGNGRVIVGSSRTSSRKCARSMTASSCLIKSRSKSVNRSREVCPLSPLLLKSFGDCGRAITSSALLFYDKTRTFAQGIK